MPLHSLSVGNNDRMCKYGEREKCSNVFADSRKRRNWPLASEVENILTHAEQRTVHGVLVDYQCKSNSRQLFARNTSFYLPFFHPAPAKFRSHEGLYLSRWDHTPVKLDTTVTGLIVFCRVWLIVDMALCCIPK